MSLSLKSSMIAVAFAAPLALPAAAQAQVARNVFGQPDISGTWSNATLTPETRPANLGERLVHTEEEVAQMEASAADEFVRGSEPTDPDAPPPPVGGELATDVRASFALAGGNVGGYNIGWLDPGNHVMRVGGEPRTSFLTTPDGRVPPRKEDAPSPPRGAGFGGSFDDPEARSLGERCIIGFGRNGAPPMLPNGFYNNNYQIVQGRDSVAIVVEMVHDVRAIRLNSEHRKDDVRPWFGDSIGWYEGDSLVVETTHLPPEQAYNGAWENLTVTERFTPTADGRLHYSYTVEDPDFWAEPWGGEYEFAPLNGRIYEYACHEGNYALEGILAGARAEDTEAAAAQ